MPQTTRAAVQTSARNIEIREFDIPEIGPDAGLLKVEATGVCGSDWPDYIKNDGTPRILGHEIVGRIERLGNVAKTLWGLKEGDRVALEEYLPCGHCDRCRTGEFRLCDATDKWMGGVRYGFSGLDVAPSLWGGYSQYVYLHPRTVFHKIPDHVPAHEAVLAQPISNGVEWAINEGGVGIGSTVVIQGPGQQGLGCVFASKMAGAANIIVSGLTADSERFKLARLLGADHTIDVSKEDIEERVKELTGGRMADVVIDVASGGPSTITTALNLVRKRGIVVVGGKKHRPLPEFYSDILVSKYITLKGVRGHSYASVEQAIEWIASGKYPINQMCTHRFSLEETHKALCTVGGEGDAGVIHVSVEPWK